LKFFVKPAVLKSVRERYGIPVHVFAEKIKEPVTTITKWEVEGAELSPTKMATIADVVSCHWSLLLRDEPLPSVKSPANKRAKNHRDGYLPDITTLVSYREANRLLDHISFSKAPALDSKLSKIINTKVEQSKSEEYALCFREAVGYDENKMRVLADSRRVYNYVASEVEKLGVYISEQNFDNEDIKGFMISKDNYYLIVVNSDDKFPASRLFTLLHEIGHILSGQKSSACDMHEVPRLKDAVEQEESFCNSFAAAFLMPAKDFQADNRIKRIQDDISSLDSELLTKLASTYRTSYPAAVRRLYQLNIIDYPLYSKFNKHFYEEILPKIIEFKNRKKNPDLKLPHAYYVNKQIKKASKSFTSIVVDRYSSGLISSGEAKRSLGVSTRYLIDIQQMVENGR
jgi:Zn-dependent peptidase ImmA (M78 family)